MVWGWFGNGLFLFAIKTEVKPTVLLDSLYILNCMEQSNYITAPQRRFYLVLSQWVAAGGTIFLGLMAYRSLRQDSVPRLRLITLEAYDGFFVLALVNAGKVPVFVEDIEVEGESVGNMKYEIVSIQEFAEDSYAGEGYTSPRTDPSVRTKLPYPLAGGEKVEVWIEVKDSEKEVKYNSAPGFFGEDKVDIAAEYSGQTEGFLGSIRNMFSVTGKEASDSYSIQR